MVPSAFIWVQDFPKTSSGKVDRNALPNPVLQRPDNGVLYSAPSTLTQKRLAEIWADMLLIDRLGIERLALLWLMQVTCLHMERNLHQRGCDDVDHLRVKVLSASSQVGAGIVYGRTYRSTVDIDLPLDFRAI